MYYELYKSIKQLITDSLHLNVDPDSGQVIGSTPGGIQDIQWFNNQYEGVIHIAPCLFIEFSPLVINRQTKQTNTTDIGIRLHVVSEVVSESDGYIPDSDVLQHEKLAHQALDSVEDKPLTFLEEETRSLRLSGWTHYHKYNGWMVTLIDLKTKG
ncbi:MAG: hypothetical protein LUG65_08050 [Clostridiales bacterium]|nr:hypothetical protein [Clostridiales bacterium]